MKKSASQDESSSQAKSATPFAAGTSLLESYRLQPGDFLPAQPLEKWDLLTIEEGWVEPQLNISSNKASARHSNTIAFIMLLFFTIGGCLFTALYYEQKHANPPYDGAFLGLLYYLLTYEGGFLFLLTILLVFRRLRWTLLMTLTVLIGSLTWIIELLIFLF